MLVVDGVRRSFGSVEAVRGVTFSVERGSVFGLLGPNGAGKTTTMRMILGIYAPDVGAITWHGARVSAATRRRFGYLPEERGLYAKMTVAEQIAYFGRLHGLSHATARERAATWMRELDLTHYARRRCGELSKGNQQKVQLASAAIHAPELLVLDEPFSGLDPVNVETFLACVRRLAAEGTTLVLSSLQLFQIEDACRTFCIVDAGEVRALGSLASLRDAFPSRTVRVVPDVAGVRDVFATYGAAPPTLDPGGALLFELPPSAPFAAILRACVAVAPVETFERREPSLGAIYARALAPVARAS